LFDSPYKIIAADIDRNNEINGIDLVELRKLILGIYTEYPENDSWKFVNKSDELTLSTAWLYQESILINDLSTSMMNEDFIGVKIGDVDASSIPNNISGRNITKRTNADFLLTYQDRFIESGEIITVDLIAQESELLGYQLELALSHFELLNVEGRDLSDDNYNMVDEVLRVSLNSDLLLEEQEALLTISLRAKASSMLSDLLLLNSSDFKSEVYAGRFLEALPIKISDGSDDAFILYQNKPNPFTDETEIQFSLPGDDQVRLLFYDVSGRLVKEMEMDGNRGLNSTMISRRDIGSAGLFYYRLESSKQFSMRQMIILE